MAKKNHGFTCTKHWKSVLVDKVMIIHQFTHRDDGTALCDSDTFDDAERLYDRKGVKTLSPLDMNLRSLILSTHINSPSREEKIRHMISCGYTQQEIANHMRSISI
jgi:DNA-binding NarL/FixJ family response regulator